MKFSDDVIRVATRLQSLKDGGKIHTLRQIIIHIDPLEGRYKKIQYSRGEEFEKVEEIIIHTR